MFSLLFPAFIFETAMKLFIHLFYQVFGGVHSCHAWNTRTDLIASVPSSLFSRVTIFFRGPQTFAILIASVASSYVLEITFSFVFHTHLQEQIEHIIFSGITTVHSFPNMLVKARIATTAILYQNIVVYRVFGTDTLTLSKSSSFPLNMCEGHCNTDDDCQVWRYDFAVNICFALNDHNNIRPFYGCPDEGFFDVLSSLRQRSGARVRRRWW